MRAVRWSWWSRIAICGLTLGLPTTGWAQSPTEGTGNAAIEKAEAAYHKGVEAFQSGDFETAFKHFEGAYLRDNAPALLYNMARCQEEMKAADRAIFYFELYLDRLPQAEDRPEVEKRLVDLKALKTRQDEEAAAAAATPNPTPASPVARTPADPSATSTPSVTTPAETLDPPSSLRPWAYVSLGLGAAAFGVATWQGLRTLDLKDQHDAATTGEEKAQTADDGESARSMTNLSLGLGAALVATGITLWLLEPDEASVTLAPSTDGGAVVWRGRW